MEAFIDVLDYYGDTTYTMLPDMPTPQILQQSSEYQLYEFSQRSPQHARLVNEEYIRRQNTKCKPLVADLKLVCLKILVGK